MKSYTQVLSDYDHNYASQKQSRWRIKPSDGDRTTAKENWPFSLGLKFRALLELHDISRKEINHFLKDNDIAEIGANFIAKGVGDPGESTLLAALSYIREHSELSYPIPDLEELGQNISTLNGLNRLLSPNANSQFSRAPFTFFGPYYQTGISNSILSLHDKDFRNILHESLTRSIVEEQQAITVISAPVSASKRKYFKDWVKEELEQCGEGYDEYSLFAIDLYHYPTSGSVLGALTEVVRQKNDNPGEEVNPLDIKTSFYSKSAYDFFEELTELLPGRKYLFAFFGFNILPHAAHVDLPGNESILGRDWQKLISYMHALTLKGIQIQLLLATSQNPTQLARSLPTKAGIISLGSNSRWQMHRAGDTAEYTCITELLEACPRHLHCMSSNEVRMLSIIESTLSDESRPFIHNNIQFFALLVTQGKVQRVIYYWFLLTLINWDKVSQVDHKEQLYRLDDKSWLELMKFIDLNALIFFLSAAICSDGIKIETAEGFCKKLVTNKQDIENFFLLDRVLKFQNISEKLLFTRPKERKLNEDIEYYYKDVEIKSCIVREFEHQLTDEQACIKGLNQDFLVQLHLLLAKASFNALNALYKTQRGDKEDGTVTDFLRKQEYFPTQQIMLRLIQTVDNLLYVAEPKKGLENATEKTCGNVKFEDHDPLSDDALCLAFENIPKITLDPNSTGQDSLENWNIWIISFAYTLIYHLLDIKTNYASSQVLEDGNRIRFALLSRFYTLRENGMMYSGADANKTTVFGSLPASVLATFSFDGNANSIARFHESLFISALHLGYLDYISNALSKKTLVLQLKQISPDINKLGNNAVKPFIVYSTPAELEVDIKLTLLRLKLNLLKGELLHGLFWGKAQLQKLRDYYQAYFNTEENGRNSGLKITKAKAYDNLLKLQAHLIRMDVAAGNHLEVEKALTDHKDIAAALALEAIELDSHPLTERYAALLRMCTLIIADKAGENEPGDTKTRAWYQNQLRHYHEKIILKQETAAENIEAFWNQLNKNRVPEKEARVRFSEFIHREVLLCSELMYYAELAEPNIAQRRDAIVKMQESYNKLSKMVLLGISPYYQMTFDIGLIRMELYRSFVEETPPAELWGLKLNALMTSIESVYPLFHCQVLILYAEYHRQLIVRIADRDAKARSEQALKEAVIAIENNIDHYGYKNRLYELQALSDFAYGHRPCSDLTKVPWLIL